LRDGGEHRLGCVDDIFVAEIDNAEPHRTQIPIPSVVIIGAPWVIMDAAFDFNDKSGGVAVEVDNEGSDGMLPAESAFGTAVVAEAFPQDALRRRGVFAEDAASDSGEVLGRHGRQREGSAYIDVSPGAGITFGVVPPGLPPPVSPSWEDGAGWVLRWRRILVRPLLREEGQPER